MSSNILDQATAIYIFVDDFLKANPLLAAWRGSNNDTPQIDLRSLLWQDLGGLVLRLQAAPDHAYVRAGGAVDPGQLG